MKNFLTILIMVLMLLAPAGAGAFDCQNPPFGAALDELNADGYFVKYLEKGGVAYYNFTGPCLLPMHRKVNPAIAWAFIDNKLYARLTRIKSGSRPGFERVFTGVYGPPSGVAEEGEWTIFSWKLEQGNKTVKLKINNKTKEIKSVFYYEPLRKLLAEAEREPFELGE
ncbi:MAG: hypothetical protein V1816_09790 [Pseudomonadota bacterium]